MKLLLKTFTCSLLLFSGCSLSNPAERISKIAQYGGSCDFINPEQTNEVETPVISMNEARNIATQFILEMGLASMNGSVKQFPQFIYMTNANFWGPGRFC